MDIIPHEADAHQVGSKLNFNPCKQNSEFFREKLASQIMPEVVAQGIVRPQRYRVIEGKTMLERCEKALDALRDGVSGEKLVWRTNDE